MILKIFRFHFFGIGFRCTCDIIHRDGYSVSGTNEYQIVYMYIIIKGSARELKRYKLIPSRVSAAL